MFIYKKTKCPTISMVLTMTINFYLDGKTNRKGEILFIAGLGIKNKSVYINTGISLEPKDRNKTRQLVLNLIRLSGIE